MKTINMSADFVRTNKVEVIYTNDGGMQIVFPKADFLVYANDREVIYLTVFNKKIIDNTLPCKDVLIDQFQYVDYIQRDGKTKLSGIDNKFRKIKNK